MDILLPLTLLYVFAISQRVLKNLMLDLISQISCQVIITLIQLLIITFCTQT